jgi:hypothetical protein
VGSTPRRRGVDRSYFDVLLGQVADLAADPPKWHEQASCRGQGPGAWFPDRQSVAAAAAAIQICTNCPVQEACAEAGQREDHGVWGGEARHLHPHQKARRPSAAILADGGGLSAMQRRSQRGRRRSVT